MLLYNPTINVIQKNNGAITTNKMIRNWWNFSTPCVEVELANVFGVKILDMCSASHYTQTGNWLWNNYCIK